MIEKIRCSTKLVVVIVSWNTRELTKDCLESVFGDLQEIDHEVWVVDNCSSDGSVKMIKNEFPQVRLIENTENLGFAKANNQALRRAIGEYYLLLNSDCIIPRGSLGKILEFMEHNPRAAAAAPRLIDADGMVQEPNLTLGLGSLSAEVRHCLVYHFYPFNKLFRLVYERKRLAWSADTPVLAEILGAACLLIRKTVFDKVGFLGEEYFLFSEEADLFRRMHYAGFKSYYFPYVQAIHLVGMSRKMMSDSDAELSFYRSRVMYFKKFRKTALPLVKGVYYLFFGWSYVISMVKSTLRRDCTRIYEQHYLSLLKMLRTTN